MSDHSIREEAEKVVDTLKELVQKGNVARILVLRNGEVLVNVPMTVGVVGTIVGALAAPWAMLTTALVTFGLDCEIEVYKTDGTVVNLNQTPVGEKLTQIKDDVKNKIRPQ